MAMGKAGRTLFFAITDAAYSL